MKRRRRQIKRDNKIIYITLAIIIAMAFFSTIFALINATHSNIIHGVRINGIDVSGMSKNEAIEKLENTIKEILEDKISLKHSEHETEITLKQLELSADIREKVYDARTVGRSQNIILNNYKILKTKLFGENINLEFKFNNEIVESIFNNLDDEWQDKFIDNGYYIEEEQLHIVKGEKGVVINKEELIKKIKEIVEKMIQGNEINEVEIPVITKNPEQIDIEKIRNEIYREAKNASYDKVTSTLYTEVDGIDFKISIEEAREIISEDKDEYIIPLQITKPEITTEKLGEEAFPKKITSFSTKYDASNEKRATNLELACEAIDGTILLPGDIFSFNKVVGPRTKAKGYELAGAYSATGLVESYGGGVCQVSSTIYNAAIYANLEIVERYNHNFIVSYLDNGRDATVSYGARDFRFKNSRTYAIKLKASAKNGILKIEIWGIPEKEEYDIEIVSETTDVIVCNTKYKYDSKLEKDEEVVETIGANGAKSIAYKIIKKNGVIISKTILSEDSYNPMTRVVRTGDRTKK